MVLLGSEAAEKEGVAWTVTDPGELPAFSLATKPQKVTMGSATLIGMKKDMV